MVRQAYGYRLALGRSAFELPVWGERRSDNSSLDCAGSGGAGSDIDNTFPSQRYNARGHPENLASRALVRRNVRAHNEVLSTVDVCARVDSEGRDVSKPLSRHRSVSERNQDLAIIQENETGLWLGVIDDMACLVATTFTANLRRRVETFSYFQGFSILQVAGVETSRFGILKFFFAGEFANTAFYLLNTAVDASIEMAHDHLVQQFVPLQRPESSRRRFKLMLDLLEHGLKLASFALLSPLQLFATLQRLDLLPAWPLLPYPFRWSYFSPLLPALPTQWSKAAVSAFAASTISSPFVAFLCMFFFTDKVKSKLCNYARVTTPRPDNPDNASFKLGIDNEASGTAPVLDYPKFQGTLLGELRRDIEYVRGGFARLHRRLRGHFRRLFDNRRPSVSFPMGDDQGSRSARHPEVLRETRDAVLPSLQAMEDDTTIQAISSPTAQLGSSTITSTSPPLTPTSSEDREVSAQEPSNVRIRTRTGSTSTLHMDVEFNAPERGGPVVTSSFAASPRPTNLETIMSYTIQTSHYRVTALTLHASESLGSHIAGALTTLLRLPLESLYVRSLARAFLGTRTTGEATWLLHRVYSLNHWILPGIGGIGWPIFMDYMGKILLCVGLETVITTEVWHLGCRFAERAGRSWYSWGNL